MANATIRGAQSIHGTNPQFLVEKVVRARIYEAPYWKEHCFALSAASILDRAIEIDHIGGLYGMQRPSPFLCLVQKLLQIQPERDILREYLASTVEFKYIRALVAFYVRLTLPSIEVYRLLEPLLEDYRKLRWRDNAGQFSVTHMDEFVDDLLRQERVCDIILPRLTKRETCEIRDGLPPRISKLHQNLMPQPPKPASQSGSDDDDGDAARWRRQRNLAPESDYTSQEETDQDQNDSDGDDDGATALRKRRRFVSPSPSISPDRQLSPTSPHPAYISRSPSRSPDRQARFTSKSPSRSPDRM